MKSPFLTTALILLPLHAALAWPFTEVPVDNSLYLQRSAGIQALQTDKDRTLEMYTGDHWLMQLNPAAGGGYTTEVQELPVPDTEPYPSNYPIAWGKGYGTSGDIDNDGDTDIVYSSVLHFSGSSDDTNVRVLCCRNDGNGAWSRGWQLKNTAAAAGGAPQVRLADFDHDGDQDLVETTGGLRIRWNDGTGNFTTASAVLHATLPTVPGYSTTPEYEVGDFDGNGWPDIAFFGNVKLNTDNPLLILTGRLMVYYNQDGVNFTIAHVQTNPSKYEFMQCGAADLNGDGRTDLIASRRTLDGGYEFQWFRNTGTSFAAGVLFHSLTTAQIKERAAFAAGDLDEDGSVDIALSTRKGEVQWLRNAGGGTFDPIAMIRPSSETTGATLGLADVDGDGDTDIMLKAAGIILLNSTPHLTGSAAATTASVTALSGAVDLTTGDLNNDGFADLIAADSGAKRIRWYTGNALGLTEQPFVSTGSVAPLGVTAGDWNKDGWTDLAWAGGGVLRQAVSSFGTGLGWFFSDADAFPGISGVVSGDVDRDGDSDIVSCSSGGGVRLHINDGTAVWQEQAVDVGLTAPGEIALGQIVPGKRQEIAALSAASLHTWRYSAGTWAETRPANPPAGTASRGLCMAEINASLTGEETIFSLNSNSVLMAHPDLTEPVTLAVFSSPVVQIEAMDWNRDAWTDLLITTTNAVYLLAHAPGPGADFESFITLFTAPAGRTLQDTAVLDVNRDTLPDAVTVDTAGALHLLTNNSSAVVTTVTPGGSRGVAARSSVEMAVIHGSYLSRVPGDAAALPSRMVLSFNRAVGTPGSDVAGPPMTDAEVNALVDFAVVFARDDTGPKYAGAASLAPLGAGQFALDFTINNSVLLSAANPERDWSIRLRLRDTAASAPVLRFFILPLAAVAWKAVPGGAPAPVTCLRSRTAGNPARTLFFLREPSPLEVWRNQHFGGPDEYFSTETIARNDADPDGDGIPNLMEYLTGTTPTVPNTLTPPVTVSYDAGLGTMVQGLRMITVFDSRVKVTLQYALNPAAGWNAIATRTGNSLWSGATPYTSTLLAGGFTRYGFNPGFDPAIIRKSFFRLQAEELP